jgi:hypothetical protein
MVLKAERPRLAANVSLIGEMPETGFTEQQWLIQRAGRFVQVTELLYRIAEHADGAQYPLRDRRGGHTGDGLDGRSC